MGGFIFFMDRDNWGCLWIGRRFKDFMFNYVYYFCFGYCLLING